MFYEKLTRIYHETECDKYFSESILKSFDKFVRKSVLERNKYINPYRFARQVELPIEDSIRFLMYFTNDNGILNIFMFFECSTSTCVSTRIFFNMEYKDEIIACDECGKEYVFEDIIDFTKVYFQIKPDLHVPPPEEEFISHDRNSTIEILRRLPDNLKNASPPSFSSSNKSIDEGGLRSLLALN